MLADRSLLPLDYMPFWNKPSFFFLPFMNKNNAAKEGTLIDVSAKSNVVGMFRPLQ